MADAFCIVCGVGMTGDEAALNYKYISRQCRDFLCPACLGKKAGAVSGRAAPDDSGVSRAGLPAVLAAGAGRRFTVSGGAGRETMTTFWRRFSPAT